MSRQDAKREIRRIERRQKADRQRREERKMRQSVLRAFLGMEAR